MTPTALLSTDFDGTIHDDAEDPPVDPRLFAALAAWRARGALWVVNTGRSLHHTLVGLVGGRFPHAPDFLVTREREIQVRNQVGRWVAGRPARAMATSCPAVFVVDQLAGRNSRCRPAGRSGRGRRG
jgi:hypothetical protein